MKSCSLFVYSALPDVDDEEAIRGSRSDSFFGWVYETVGGQCDGARLWVGR